MIIGKIWNSWKENEELRRKRGKNNYSEISKYIMHKEIEKIGIIEEMGRYGRRMKILKIGNIENLGGKQVLRKTIEIR